MSEPFTFTDRDGDYFIPKGWYFRDMIIMLFIWLKDKKCNNVYVGDIVLMSDEAYNLPNEKMVIESYFWMFKWHPSYSRFYAADSHELCRDHLWNHKPKHWIAWHIIGNIYENPELLEPTN